jgi:DNA-binding transcriptional MerR regulator
VAAQADLRSRSWRHGNHRGHAAVRCPRVDAALLRGDEEKGLISSTGRRGQRRLFDAGVLERLALIALGRVGGFSLDEIALMLLPDGRPNVDRRMLAAKADELDRTIRELSAVRDGLRHAAGCPAPSHMECPTFRGILSAAAAGTIKPPRNRVGPTPRRPRGTRSG